MTIIGALPFLLQNGTTADATEVDADLDAIVSDVNANAAHNGVNADITQLAALSTPITQAQGATNVWVDDFSTSTGSANAQVVDSSGLKPAGFSLTQGNRIAFLAGFTNTGPLTLNVGGTGATTVFRQTPLGPIACTGGEVVANNTVEAIVDVFGFVLLENGAGINIGPYDTVVSSPTPNLGVAPSHNVAFTGTATITSFGSSATLAYPIYNIYFAGVMTLVHSANLFLLGEANITTAPGDTAVMVYGGADNWFMTAYARQNGEALVVIPPVSSTVPTTQVFTSGSGTYTPTSGSVRYIVVRAVGAGGGGGGGQNAAAATSGGATTFGALTGSGGAGGSLSAAGAGGGASGGFSNTSGGSGGPPTPPGTAYNGWGGGGGSSALGGGGAPATGNNTGSAGATNTGAGGGGGGATNGTLTGSGGAGGGGGGCAIGIMVATTYSYSVGASGAGAAGSSSSSSSGGNGGAGAAGKIEVIEYY